MKNILPKRQSFWRLLPAMLAFMLLAISGRGQTYLQESFDGTTFPPTGWTQAQLNLTGLWTKVTSGTYPTCANHSGAGMLQYNCFSYSNGTAAAIISPNIDLSAASNVSVEFWMYRDAGYSTNIDNVEVFINTAANVTGATSLGVINRPKASAPIETGADGWYKYSFTIPASFNTAINYLLFKATAKYGNNIFVDDIKVFTPTIPNGVPTTFSTTAVSKTGMTINWVDNSTNETGFSVYMSSDNIAFSKYGTDVVSTSSATTGNSYSANVTGLTYGHTYYFEIVAYSGGETAPLIGNQATLPGDAGDAAPTSLTFSSVGLSAMTLNWLDNSTNEIAFRVYRATDIAGPYTQVGTDISSATSAGTGTAYNAVSTGLTQSTTYYYKVVAVCDLESAALSGSSSTIAPVPISGTFTVGHASAAYQTLTAAFADITGNGLAGPVQLVLQADYDAWDEPVFPIVPSKIATATNTITIYPATSGVIVDAGGQAAGLFNFDGVKYVTFDGRVGRIGSIRDLVIKNGSMASYVFQFVNDASNNTLEYCTIKGGSNTATVGLINFSGTTGTTGNSNNIIDNCTIAPSVISFATGIYSSGQGSGKENRDNTISNCNIYNFRSSAANPNGIFLSSNNTDWTITGNSFYQTAAYAAYAYTTYGINITSGNNHTVNNNFIGGQSANCGGSPWTVNGTMAASKFVGINLSVGTTMATSIQNNTIKNISWWSTSGSSASPGVWCGINVASGKVNVGTTTGNTIGGDVGTESITISTSSSPAIVYGIVSASSSTVSISNNKIGSIKTNSITTGGVASTTNSVGVIGINTASSGIYAISNNLIGSLTEANSINAATASAATSGQVVIGIWHSGTTSADINGNTIANLKNAYAGTGITTCFGMMRGILIGSALSTSLTTTASVNTIVGNTVRDITTASPYTGTTSTAVLIGIEVLSNYGNQSIAQNSIYNISNTAATGNVSLIGLYLKLNTSVTNTIERNSIYNLSLSTSGSGVITGILAAYGGTSNYQNNIIALGNGLTNNLAITGIDDGLGTNNYYFNSVFIGGSVSSGSTSTYAFNSSITSNVRSFKNNIFVNARSNSGATAKHYAIKVSGTGVNPSGLSCNNNILQSTGTGNVLGYYGADQADLTAWQTASGQDANSLVVDPKFVDPTAAVPDLHLQGGSPADMAGIDIPTITNDYFGDIRASLTPTDIGADAGNFDSAIPTVAITPNDGATAVSVGDNVIFTFSEKVRKTDNSVVDASVISFVNVTNGNSAVPFQVVYDDPAKTLTVKLLPEGTAMLGFKNYKVTITGVEDYNDNALAPASTSFTTGTADAIAPIFIGAAVENAAPKNVVVTFSENVKMTSADGFTVKVAGNTATITSNAFSNNQLTLTLADAITTHQVVTVEYAGGNVKDISDNVLVDFTAQTVTNTTKSNAKDFLTFSFLKVNNPTLPEDVAGVIGGNCIDLYVPAATIRTGLKATFTNSQYIQFVEVGTTLQTSDVNTNDFTAAVTYKVTAEDNSTVNITVMVHFIHAVPYTQNFDAASFPPTDWMVINAGTGSSWSRSGSAQAGAGSMYYYSNSTNAANAWAYTPALNLVAGKKYVVEFWEKAAGALWSEKLKVTVGQQPNVAAQTTELWKDENITNSSWTKVKTGYTVPTSGIYHFGFNCFSSASQYNLYVDEVVVREINNNALLSSINVDGAALTGFTGTTFTYSKVLPYGTTIVPLISGANLADANATVIITQATSLTGTATVVVTAEDGVTVNTYAVVYSVAKNPDAKLIDLKVDNATVTGFSSTVYTYSAALPYDATDVPQITGATLSNSGASFVTSQAINLTGSLAERSATVVVTAEDGASTATYSVVFSLGVPNTYAVNFSVVGANGTITAIVDGGYISNGDLVVEGKSVEFTAIPAVGYRVKEWKNITVVSGNTTNSYTLAGISAAATVSVEFEQIPVVTYAVNFSVVGSNGAIAATVDGTSITSGDMVADGKSIVFASTPAAGYRVKEWKNVNVVNGNTSNRYTLVALSAAATVSVEFEQIPAVSHAVNFSVVGANGTIAATVNGTPIASGDLVVEGNDVVFTASPANGYRVKEWNNGAVVVGNTANSYTISSLASELNVTVEFMLITGVEDADAVRADAYPNPFQTSIRIKNASELSRVEILNVGGQVLNSMDSGNSNELVLSTDDLTIGIYFIRMIDSKGNVSIKKMIKE